MPEFVLHVPDIDEVGKDFDFVLSPAWVDVALQDASLRADPRAKPGVIRAHVQLNGTEYLVTGTIKAALVTECGRCLADAPVPVDVQFGALYSRAAGHGHAEGNKKRAGRVVDEEVDEATDDELQRETFSGNDIALDDLVREHLVLEVPMQPLCSEDCQGIAVPQHIRPPEDTFHSDGAVDPRLAPLQRLRDNVPPSPAQPAPTTRVSARANRPNRNELPGKGGLKTDTDKE